MFDDLRPFKKLSPGIRELCDSAIVLARDDMGLLDLDPAVFLRAILNLGGSNEQAKWLYKVGLRNGDVTRIIQEYSEKRVDKQLWDGWGRNHPVPDVVVFTPAAHTMIKQLVVAVSRPTRPTDTALVLRGVVLSESEIVEQIFGSVGFTMNEVRRMLYGPSIITALKQLRATSRR